MKALQYNQQAGVRLVEVPKPDLAGEACIRVLRAGICSTDLEILKGYVPGYDFTLGHEFVGVVESCPDRLDLIGQRVVGEINCPCDSNTTYEDPIFARNHYPRRTVLGIIARQGCMAEYVALPPANLHLVPAGMSDEEACFAEPLAAACRIVEQGLIGEHDSVAVVGDGKLGLLVAGVAALRRPKRLVHFGRHQHKLDLIPDTDAKVVLSPDQELPAEWEQAFDMCIEASGSSQGIKLALALVRPMGTVVQKTTCSAVGDAQMPAWSDIANDVVVNEKRLVGSRCGPFPPALEALQQPSIQDLVRSMVSEVIPISSGLEAISLAQTKGVLKVQLRMDVSS